MIKQEPEGLVYRLKNIKQHYLSITTEEWRKEFYLEMRRCFNEEVLNSLDKSTILIFLTERVSTAFTAVKTKEIECLFENNSL